MCVQVSQGKLTVQGEFCNLTARLFPREQYHRLTTQILSCVSFNASSLLDARSFNSMVEFHWNVNRGCQYRQGRASELGKAYETLVRVVETSGEGYFG